MTKTGRKRWQRFTNEEIETFVKESRSWRELLLKIGYRETGANRITVREMAEELNLSTEHFKGQGWNKDNFDYTRFRKDNYIRTDDALNALVALRGRKCEICGTETWNGKEIPLETHHVDGDRSNNELTNLQICCPNCHAQTDNFRRKDKKVKQVSDEKLVDSLKTSETIGRALINVGLTAKGGNYRRAYDLVYKHNIKQHMHH